MLFFRFRNIRIPDLWLPLAMFWLRKRSSCLSKPDENVFESMAHLKSAADRQCEIFESLRSVLSLVASAIGFFLGFVSVAQVWYG